VLNEQSGQHNLNETIFVQCVLAEYLEVDEILSVATPFQSTEISISEIGYLLGFSEPGAFNRAFKRWTGKTPKEFQKANKSI